MTKTFQRSAFVVAVSLACFGTAYAQSHDHGSTPAAKPVTKAAAKPVKPAADMEHEHNCQMMEGMMSKKGMGGMMASGSAPHDAMSKRVEQLEKRLDMMQATLEHLLRRPEAAAATK